MAGEKNSGVGDRRQPDLGLNAIQRDQLGQLLIGLEDEQDRAEITAIFERRMARRNRHALPSSVMKAVLDDEVDCFREALKGVDTDGHSEVATTIQLLAAAEERRRASEASADPEPQVH